MKKFALAIAVVAIIALGLSIFADARFAPLIGAVALIAAIGYAMIRNKTASRATLVKAEQGARKLREES